MRNKDDKKTLDLENWCRAIQAEYVEVALRPDKAFHFHTGRPLSRISGCDEAWLEGTPESSFESFEGTGQSFSPGEIKTGERVVDIGGRAGIDRLVATHTVGLTRQTTGVDMTPTMLAKPVVRG